MDNLLNAANKVAMQVFSEYVERGGVIRDGARILSIDEAASTKGALTPLLWMMHEFITEYEIECPTMVYSADPESMVGMAITGMEVSRSASPVLFMLSDFLRSEIVPETVKDFDVSLLFSNFKEWAAQQESHNVVAAAGAQQPAPSHIHEPE